MTPAEQVMIAHIARYHRGAPPKSKHVGFGELDRASRERIIKLSAILRFADGMDRGHVAAVDTVTVKWGSDEVRVHLHEMEGATSVRLECWGGSRKRHLLEEVLERRIVVVAPDGTEISADDLDGE
jgi:exopolyphosphatase/guanosine-5'-triphosphate,3'-diphosphate pyrophosphatase